KAFADFLHSDSDMKLLIQVFSQLPSQFESAGRGDVDVLSHARFFDISIHGLSAVQDGVIPSAQELQDRVLDHRQRMRLAHDELLECQRAVAEHSHLPTVTSGYSPPLSFSRTA